MHLYIFNFVNHLWFKENHIVSNEPVVNIWIILNQLVFFSVTNPDVSNVERLMLIPWLFTIQVRLQSKAVLASMYRDHPWTFPR
jgi:hypothetical protein